MLAPGKLKKCKLSNVNLNSEGKTEILKIHILESIIIFNIFVLDTS